MMTLFYALLALVVLCVLVWILYAYLQGPARRVCIEPGQIWESNQDWEKDNPFKGKPLRYIVKAISEDGNWIQFRLLMPNGTENDFGSASSYRRDMFLSSYRLVEGSSRTDRE